MGRRKAVDKPRRDWGTIRWRKDTKSYSASYRHGGIRGVQESTEYFSPVTFQTTGDAETWLKKERKLIEAGEWAPPADREIAKRLAEEEEKRRAVTLDTMAEQWLTRPHATKDSTHRRYEQSYRLYIHPRFGSILVKDITPAMVEDWWNTLPLERVRRQCDLAYSAFKAIMAYAVEKKKTTENPVQPIGNGANRAGRGSRERSIDHPLEPDQVRAVADNMPERWALAIGLGAWCALRSGEVRELRRKDIDIEHGIIHVTRAIVDGKIGSTKTEAGDRKVLMPPPVIKAVKTHLKDYAQIGPEGLLFYETETGKNIPEATFRRAWTRALIAAGIPAGRKDGYIFHDLRHVGLTHMAGAGATVKELEQQAGHTTPAMALRYQEVADKHMGEVMANLGRMIEGRKGEEATL